MFRNVQMLDQTLFLPKVLPFFFFSEPEVLLEYSKNINFIFNL